MWLLSRRLLLAGKHHGSGVVTTECCGAKVVNILQIDKEIVFFFAYYDVVSR